MNLARNIQRTFVIVLTALLVVSSLAQPTLAAGTPGWEAGRIIDDSVMTRYSAMTVSQIQSFLNSKVSSCDTYGQKLSEYGGPDLNGDGKVQRWEWGKSKYNQTKFVCLKDYKVSDGRTAARVLYDVGHKYKINPQVLIVLLQKEQGLVTDTWPLNIQYRSATGYGCPDTAPCDSQYYGLINQLDWSAKMYRSIISRDPDWYSPYVAGYNPRVYWHPDTSRCGSRSLTIENWSTAALYSYTPYRPNQAALDAGYGTGNSCSSYGNRNFYLYFRDWFGSPRGATVSIGYLNTPQQITTNASATASFWVRNNTKQTIKLGRIKVMVRSSSGENYDYPGVDDVSIGPGDTFTYKKSRTFDKEGGYTFSIARYANSQWHSPPFSDFGISTDPSYTRIAMNKPTLTASSTLTPAAIHVGQTVGGKFTVKNNSALYDINLGRMKIAVRKDGKGYDFPSSSEISLSPGASYAYNQPRTFPSTGKYTFWLANYRSDHGWSETYPASANSSILREGTVTVKDSATLTQSLQLSPNSNSLHVNQSVTASFKIKNFSATPVNVGSIKVAVRDGSGKNHDFPSSGELALNPGQEYTYSKTRTLPKTGKYTFWLASYRDNHGWSATYPVNEATGMTRQISAALKESVTLTSSVDTSPLTGNIGQAVTTTFKIKNFGTSPASIGRFKIAVRDAYGRNYDFPSSSTLTLNPGQEYTYSKTRTLPKTGKYTFWLASYRDNHGWSTTFPPNESSGIKRSGGFTIK